jgi:hypothetical protein
MDQLIIINQSQKPLRSKEVAALMGISIKRVSAYVKRGLIPCAFKPVAGLGWGQNTPLFFKRKVFLSWWEQQQETPVFKPFTPRRPRSKKL